jgi:hypothetical protein
MLDEEYYLEPRLEAKSKAKLFRFLPIKKFVMKETYEWKLILKNKGGKDFPGGTAVISTRFTTVNQEFKNEFEIGPVPVNDEIGLIPVNSPGKTFHAQQALGDGFALFCIESITSNDGKTVKTGFRSTQAFGTIFAYRWIELHTYWLLIIAVIALFLNVLTNMGLLGIFDF